MKPRRAALLLVLATASIGLAGCNPCLPGPVRSVDLGEGVSGLYALYEEGDTVQLDDAPQGGLGVSTVLWTTGLRAHQSNSATALLEVFVDGESEGHFLSEELWLVCSSSGHGGSIHGQVVGFEEEKYPEMNDFIDLDGKEVELRVTVTDLDGFEAFGSTVVTLEVGL